METYSVRRIDPCLEKYLLCKAFVHCDRTSERIRPGIADAEQVKCCLKFSVLTFSAVKSEEGDICHPAELDYIRPEETVRLVRARGFDGREIRFFLADVLRDLQSVSGHREYILQILRCIFKSQKYIQKKCIVSSFQQCPADSGSRGEGNIALCT